MFILFILCITNVCSGINGKVINTFPGINIFSETLQTGFTGGSILFQTFSPKNINTKLICNYNGVLYAQNIFQYSILISNFVKRNFSAKPESFIVPYFVTKYFY